MIYHIFYKLPGDRIPIKWVDNIHIYQIKSIFQHELDESIKFRDVYTYDLNLNDLLLEDHTFIMPDGSKMNATEFDTDDKSVIIRKASKKAIEIYKNFDLNTVPDKDDKVAMTTFDTKTAEAFNKLFPPESSETKGCTTEFDVIKSLLTLRPYLGEIYKVSRKDPDKSYVEYVYDSPKEIEKIKDNLLLIRTRKEDVIPEMNLYIGDYNPGYIYHTTEGYDITRNENGYSIERTVKNDPDKVTIL